MQPRPVSSLRKLRHAALRGLMALKSDAGSALEELALFMALLGVPVLLGTADLSCVTYYAIEIANAAHAGALFGMTSGSAANDVAGITAAARAEASDLGSNLQVSPSSYWVCSANEAGAHYALQTDATSACSGAGNHPLQFVSVTVSATVTPPIHLRPLPSSFTVTRSSVMEVEE